MSSPETKTPYSTIRHRPIFLTSQVTPLVLRASNLSISLRPVVGERDLRHTGTLRSAWAWQ